MKKIIGCILGLLALSLVMPSVAKAQQSQTSNSQPVPVIATSGISKNVSSSGIVEALGVLDLPDTESTWSASRLNMPQNPSNLSQGTYLAEGFQGNLQPTINGTSYCLEFNLRSCQSQFKSSSNPLGLWNGNPGNIPSSIWINCSYGVIPIWLYNATNFTFEAGNCTYIDGLPTIKNNVTFNNVALNTYGHGLSTFNLVINQEVVENWTEVKIKIGVYADLLNTKLYLANGSELPQGTQYSLNFQWGVDLSNFTAAQLLGYPIGFNYVASGTNLYFVQNDSQHTPLPVVNLRLGDSYTEIQGSNQEAVRTAEAEFISSNMTLGNSVGKGKVPGCLCYQSFSNLTYGLTTGVLSDPLLGVQHPRVQAPSVMITIGGIPMPMIILGVAITVAILGIALYKKRKHTQ